MSKFNKPGARPVAGRSPITSTTPVPVILGHQGGQSYERDSRSELFVFAVSNLGGEKTYHEGASARDERYANLVHAVAPNYPVWMAGFIPWLRNSANMRTAPLVGALESARSMLTLGIAGSRQLIASSMSRPDEPGEAVAYWMKHYGRRLPMPVKRGIADAARRLYTEAALLKYDTSGKPFRFADVIELCHVRPDALWRSDLYKYALDRRHNRSNIIIPATLPTIQHRADLKGTAVEEMSQADIKLAGMTWENTISAAVDKKAAWENTIPTMGYMALLRNLRNFDEAGISAATVRQVIDRLTDPEEVKRSRQFPFRFLSAYTQLNSLTWGHALETALNLSLQNLPALRGRTLILVDRSDSMFYGLSEYSSVRWAAVAAMFGTALYLRNQPNATLVQYGSRSVEMIFPKSMSILRAERRFSNLGGTRTATAIRERFTGHDRIIVITDEQVHSGEDPSKAAPASVPMYTFNLAGYRPSQVPDSANRVTIGGGLTDKSFQMIALLEAGRDGVWPWEEERAQVRTAGKEDGTGSTVGSRDRGVHTCSFECRERGHAAR
jgi:hypothetical protein